MAFRDMMPLLKASTAAASGGVLGDEYRMATHGSLPAVIGYLCRSKPLRYELPGMILDRIEALVKHIVLILLCEMEA